MTKFTAMFVLVALTSTLRYLLILTGDNQECEITKINNVGYSVDCSYRRRTDLPIIPQEVANNLVALQLHGSDITNVTLDSFKNFRKTLRILSIGSIKFPCDCSISKLWRDYLGIEAVLPRNLIGFHKEKNSFGTEWSLPKYFPSLTCYDEAAKKWRYFDDVDLHHCKDKAYSSNLSPSSIKRSTYGEPDYVLCYFNTLFIIVAAVIAAGFVVKRTLNKKSKLKSKQNERPRHCKNETDEFQDSKNVAIVKSSFNNVNVKAKAALFGSKIKEHLEKQSLYEKYNKTNEHREADIETKNVGNIVTEPGSSRQKEPKQTNETSQFNAPHLPVSNDNVLYVKSERTRVHADGCRLQLKTENSLKQSIIDDNGKKKFIVSRETRYTVTSYDQFRNDGGEKVTDYNNARIEENCDLEPVEGKMNRSYTSNGYLALSDRNVHEKEKISNDARNHSVDSYQCCSDNDNKLENNGDLDSASTNQSWRAEEINEKKADSDSYIREYVTRRAVFEDVSQQGDNHLSHGTTCDCKYHVTCDFQTENSVEYHEECILDVVDTNKLFSEHFSTIY